MPDSSLPDTTGVTKLPGGGVDLYFAPAKFHQQFAADVPAAEAALMAATQRPVTAAALDEASGAAAWKEIPAWFLIPAGNKNIPPAAQRFMAERAGGRMVEVAGASHAVAVSRPDAVAKLIAGARSYTRTHDDGHDHDRRRRANPSRGPGQGDDPRHRGEGHGRPRGGGGARRAGRMSADCASTRAANWS